MNKVRVTPEKPSDIQRGLDDGALKQIGGVIVDIAKDEALAFVREVYEAGGADFVKDLTAGVALSAVDGATFNLAISTMGFAVVIRRLSVIEQELRRAQELLSVINHKIDLSFYSNFRAAVDLAGNSFAMVNPEMRKAGALQAIDRLLVAEHHYMNLADIEIANQSQIADDFLATASLAYIAETRCYLELEEIDTARQRLQDATSRLRDGYARHIRTLLTGNPAAYLHPHLEARIDLRRLTRVFRWLDGQLDENSVFQTLRLKLFDLAVNPKAWMQSLPQAVFLPKRGLFDNAGLSTFTSQLRKIVSGDDLRARAAAVATRLNRQMKNIGNAEPPQNDLTAALERLPECLQLMEQMIENYQRLAMYKVEIQAIKDLGLSFREWKELRLDPREAGKSPLLYIVRSEAEAQAA
jgi:hypothetical protein